MRARQALRASDADRERLVAELREHAVAGRLTVEELAERTEHALVAVTLGDLAALADDLPTAPTPPRRRRLPLRRRHVAAYAGTNCALLGAWVVTNGPGGTGTGPEPFWPLWPMVAAAAGLGALAARSLRAGRRVPAAG